MALNAPCLGSSFLVVFLLLLVIWCIYYSLLYYIIIIRSINSFFVLLRCLSPSTFVSNGWGYLFVVLPDLNILCLTHLELYWKPTTAFDPCLRIGHSKVIYPLYFYVPYDDWLVPINSKFTHSGPHALCLCYVFAGGITPTYHRNVRNSTLIFVYIFGSCSYQLREVECLDSGI